MGYIGQRANVDPVSFIAGGTIEKGNAVKLDSTEGQVIECTAATDEAIGIALETGTSGQALMVQTLGTCLGLADAAITAGAWVCVSATTTAGRLKTLASTGYAIGRSITAAGAAGDYFWMVVAPQYLVKS